MVLAPSSAAGGLTADDPPSLGGEGGKVPVVASLTGGIIGRVAGFVKGRFWEERIRFVVDEIFPRKISPA